MNHMPSAPRWPRRLAIIAFGLLLSWLLIEVVFRLAFDSLPPRVQADIQSVQRWPWSAEAIIPPFPYITDRDFQARLAPGLRDYPIRWSDARFSFDTIAIWDGHRAGLRSDSPRWPLDILTLGDSFTFGWVAKADGWAQQLADKYGWHVFNAGNPGTGAAGQLALLKEIAGPVQPALVVWQWYANDLKDDHDRARIRGEAEPLGTAPYPDPPPAPEGLGRFSALAHLLRVWTTPRTPSTPYAHYQAVRLNDRPVSVHTNEYAHPDSLAWPVNEYGVQSNAAAQAEGERFLREEVGAALLLVFIPTKEEAYAAQLTTLGADYLEAIGEGRRRLLAQCAARGWHCIDALPALREAVARGETVYYAFDSHLDASGNRVLARLVYEYIVANKLVAER